MRWKADFDSAADEYSQAAQCYRIAREVQLARDCYVKAADLYKKNKSLFHAAKALENVMILCKEHATDNQIYDWAMDASTLYQEHGSGDSAANILDKAAKILEPRSAEMAVKLYLHAADVSSTESGQHQGAEYLSKASRILVRLERYDEAMDSIRREIGFHQEAGNIGQIGRLCVVGVLIQLARGDVVAAEKVYKEWGNSCEAPEMTTIEQALQAFDEEDREAAQRALSSPFIRSMDVDYARLATKIPLPQAIEPAPRAQVRPNAAPSYVSANAVADAEVTGTNVNARPSASQGEPGIYSYPDEEDNEESPYVAVTYGKKEQSDEEEELC
ncbi:gamma-soluble NSF attachment protein-like isoform X2 [Hyposmocoma kahamanoa]|nr:gamma-soluble NSF attachment protein-like isoform X2 [Hyposmocoma kahamanoa]